MNPKQMIGMMLTLIMVASIFIPMASAADNSSGIDLTASIKEPGPEIAIELSETTINFGDLLPGQTSEPSSLTVINIGIKDITVDVTVTDNGPEPLFIPGVLINGAAWGEYSATLTVDDQDDLGVALHIPESYASRGPVSGSMTVWAEERVGGPTALYDDDVELTAGDTFDFTAMDGTEYTGLAIETDMGALFSTGLDFEASDDYHPSFWIESIEGLANEPWSDDAYSWSIFINDVYATTGLYGNAVVNGDNVKFYYLQYDPDTYEPLVDTALYIVDIDVVVNGASVSESWAMFQGNQQLNGYYAGDAPDSNNLKWVSAAIGAVPSSSVAIAEGKVFVYCLENGQGYVAALDVNTGALLWKKETIVTNTMSSWATPAYHDGLVFMHGDTARYASNGEPAWPAGRYLPDDTNGGPMIAEGKVFIGNWDGHKYFAFNEKTGQQIWEFTAGGYAQGTPSYHDGKLFLTSWGYNSASYLYCVYASNGTQVWSASSSAGAKSFCGSASVANGYVYTTTYDFSSNGELYCFYESNGTLVWKQEIMRTDSTPAVHDGRVYVTGGCEGYSPHYTYCFDALTGALIWSTEEEENIGGWTCSVVVADGKLFVGREAAAGEMEFSYSDLFALDITDGDVLWHADNGGATVAIVDGVVFTAGMDGKIYAYGPSAA